MNSFTPNILVGTPAYGGMVHTDYVSTLLQFQTGGVPFTLMTIGNESLITRARNTILSAFHVRPEFSHLLFLDGDVQLPADGLKRMLAQGKDVIGAPVALKGKGPDGRRIFNIGACLGEEGSLQINERIGTAAFMLSRRAVEALVDDAKRDGRVYRRSRTTRGAWDADIHYDVFQTGVIDGEYLSEDYWVCRELRRLGFSVFVDPTVVTRHHGTIAT